MNFLPAPTNFPTFFFLGVALLSAAAFVRAEVIPASRVTNWQGNVGVEGGIPKRTTIFKTLGHTSTAAQINAAIASCPPNQVVFLQAGRYKLESAIEFNNKKGVTLRGVAGKTILEFSGYSYANIYFRGSNIRDMPDLGPDLAKLRNWTAGYTKGTTQITLSSTAGLQVGWVLVLDQLNDAATGVTQNGSEGCPYCSRQKGGRVQQQNTKITAINGNVVTISPALYMDYVASRSPQAYWWGSSTEMCGVEDLMLDHTKSSSLYGIALADYYNCWAQNIQSFNANIAHFYTAQGARAEVGHSYFYGTQHAASSSYGVLWSYSSANLCEDNIFQHITTSIMQGATSSGCVNSYNYSLDQYYPGSPGWMMAAVATHAAHNHFNLFEGNYVNAINLDFIHGSGGHNTIFRNRMPGWEAGKTSNLHSVTAASHNRYLNVVGNILGTNYHLRYADLAPGAITETSIYKLGFFGSYVSYSPDLVVASTILQHGNWDSVTEGIVWNASIPDHAIPPSLYLASKPSWFGNLAWPPFSATKPAATKTDIPAGVRFANAAHQLRNISARAFVQGQDNVLIGGFIINGTGQKRIALRALGPSLPLSPALGNPSVELRDAKGALLAKNDNWRTTQAADILAAGMAPSDDREATLIRTLSPGKYTALVRGVSNTTGIGLVEIYDLDTTGGPTRLGNISARGNVLGGNGVLIGGFIIGGGDWSPLVVARAVGPSLTKHGVSGALSDPTLDLRDANGVSVAFNDNWKEGRTSDITAEHLGLSDTREAAISTHLAPGNYTAIVSGKNGATGVGLVEIYSSPERLQ
jgi:hypothetical protein